MVQQLLCFATFSRLKIKMNFCRSLFSPILPLISKSLLFSTLEVCNQSFPKWTRKSSKYYFIISTFYLGQFQVDLGLVGSILDVGWKLWCWVGGWLRCMNWEIDVQDKPSGLIFSSSGSPFLPLADSRYWWHIYPHIRIGICMSHVY